MVHDDIRKFLTDMNNDMRNRVVAADFFHLNGPVVGNITRAIFDSVLKEYNAEVVISIHNLSQNYMNDCIILAQKILPKFAESNVGQRGAAIYRQITDGGNIMTLQQTSLNKSVNVVMLITD